MLRAASRLLTIAAIALPCIPGMARAQDSSAWDAEPHATARLIAGAALRSADAAWLRAGIEIRLDTGWKTYWRYPGDSGVPPTLDFAGSENVKSVTVLWPAPTRFAEGAGGHSIGYQGHVVLAVGGPGARVVVEVAAPAGTPVDLFAEGPAADWALPLPEASGGGAGTRRFTFDLDGLPPGSHVDGATLTLTATSPDEAIEVPVHL